MLAVSACRERSGWERAVWVSSRRERGMAERAIIENSTREYRRQRRMADDRVIQCWGGGCCWGAYALVVLMSLKRCAARPSF